MGAETLPRAVDWARAVPADEASMAALEAHVLRGHPRMLAMLGWVPAAEQAAPRRRPGRGRPVARGPLAALRGLVVLVVVLAPMIGAASLTLGGPILVGRVARADSDPIDVDLLFPLVTVCFALALMQPLAGFRSWLRRGRTRRRHDLVQPVLVCVLAASSLVGVIGRAHEADATAPVIVTACTAVASLLLTVAIATSPRVLGTTGWHRTTRPPRVESATAAIAALPEAERAAMQQEARAALRVLVERGIIAEAAERRAADAALGSLSSVAAST